LQTVGSDKCLPYPGKTLEQIFTKDNSVSFFLMQMTEIK
jgi:hypothetical protein